MPDEITTQDLSKYRFAKAVEDWETAQDNYNNKKYRAANNRAYYAIFHAMRSVLALDKFDAKKHSAIISEFRKRYIKTEIFDKEISDMIEKASFARNASDYDDMYVVNKNDTMQQIENAEKCINAVKQYLEAHGVELE